MFASRATRSFAALRVMVMAIAAQGAGLSVAVAHEGPPFPILMDQPAGRHIVSVWADPDIGDAQFFIIIESPTGGPPSDVPQVSMWVEPVSGRLDRVTYQANQQPLRNQLQFEATPHFDQGDMWNIGFQIISATGESQELTTEIESTPPGYGLWDLAIYLFPFLLLGGMWMVAMLRRRRTHGKQSLITTPECNDRRDVASNERSKT